MTDPGPPMGSHHEAYAVLVVRHDTAATVYAYPCNGAA